MERLPPLILHGGKCYIHLCVCVCVTYTYLPLPPTTMKGFPGGASGEESACQCRRTKRMWVRSLGREDPLEEEMATHSSILARRMPWSEEPGTLRTVHGVTKSRTRLKQLSISPPGKGSSQSSKWKNPRKWREHKKQRQLCMTQKQQRKLGRKSRDSSTPAPRWLSRSRHRTGAFSLGPVTQLGFTVDNSYIPMLLSRFSHVWLRATPQTAAQEAPLSLGFSRQEHWSGLPFPSPMRESEKWKWSRSVVSDS